MLDAPPSTQLRRKAGLTSMGESCVRRGVRRRTVFLGAYKGAVSARCQHAEFVALGVGHHDPGNITLSDVDPPSFPVR